MKKYLIPAAMIGDHEVAGSFFVAYFFLPDASAYTKRLRNPSSSAVGPEGEPEGRRRRSRCGAVVLRWGLPPNRAVNRAGVLPQDWADYRQRFAEIQNSVEAMELSHKRFFPQQFDSAKASVDAEGHPWLTMEIDGATRQVGISNRNLMSAESDPELAFQLMLGRVGYALHAKNHFRETMEEFRKDWSLLEETRNRLLSNREHLKIASLP